LNSKEDIERLAKQYLPLADELDSHNKFQWEHNWELHYDLKEGDIYVEAGAFWGRYGREALPKVGESGRLILIEPSPENFRALELWVERDNLKNVTLVNKAVSDRKGTLPFVAWGNPAGHRFAFPSDITHPEYGEYIVEVEVDTLDSIFEELEIDHVDLLSCDVEDAEIDLVNGCKGYLSKHRVRNVALGAYHADHMPITNPDKIIPILKAWGYKDLIYEEGIVFGHV
jgi:FkbM family methyltransferase